MKEQFNHHEFLVIGCVGGYKISLCVDNPLEIVISPSLHPIKSFAVANHGLPKIIGCHLEGSFDSMTIKSTGYSHEAIDTIISSKTPVGLTVVQSSSSRIEGVGRRNCPNYKTSKIVVAIILIENPISISVFSMEMLFTITVTTSLPRFVYSAILDWSVTHSDIYPMT